jgi:propionyl-CoA synthetase
MDEAINLAAHKPQKTVIYQRPQVKADLIAGRDLDWEELMKTAKAVPCVPVAATDPLYILYTSGTTGKPKGVMRDNGGHAVALKWSMKHIYDIKPGEVFWAASDVGWVVGHSLLFMHLCCMAVPRLCTRASPSERPIPVPSGASFPSMAYPFCLPRRQLSVPSKRKIPTGIT